MPGEDRKFKRRRMMAFVPFCNREREEADSHADATAVPGIGVEVEDGAGVAVEDRGGVAVGAALSVTIGEGRGGIVSADAIVVVGESKGV